MNVRFKAVFLIFLFLAVLPLPVYSSVTRGTLGLKTASTEHFDIIYQKQCLETASLIYENCEKIYASLVEFFGSDPSLKIPVVVTSEFKTLNAYFTNIPANRIVIFDTVSAPGSLSNFPQTVLYIFRHELTHAFQFNYRGPFIQKVADIFGDAVTLSPLAYMYPSLAEGGAVLSESFDGYGRLNDSSSMQIVKQAKLEGRFPSWLEVSGARDTYPSSLLYYNFAAAFLSYLAQTFGLEKVSDLYVSFGKPGWFETTSSIIKKHIGISVNKAWKDFYDWVEVPSDVVYASFVDDIPYRGMFSEIRLSPDGSLYLYDSATGRVLKISGASLPAQPMRVTEAAFVPSNEAGLSISSDGSKMLASYVTESFSGVRLYAVSSKVSEGLSAENPVKKAELLGMFSKKSDFLKDIFKPKSEKYGFEDSEIRSGCFVTLDGIEYALLFSNMGQTSYLGLYDLETFERVEGKSVCLGYGVTASDFEYIGDGRAAFLTNFGSNDSIAVIDLSEMSVKQIPNPDGMKIRSLSLGYDGNKNILCFSWFPSSASSVNLGRYGEITFDGGSYSCRLSPVDVSGSVNSPLRMGESVVFAASCYDGMRLCTIAASSLKLSDAVEVELQNMAIAQSPDTLGLSLSSGGYKAVKYLKDGILFPAALYSGKGSISDIFLGATWITQDPTETYRHTVSAGFSRSELFASYDFSSTAIIPYSLHVSGLCDAPLTEGSFLGDFIHGSKYFNFSGDVTLGFELRHPGETLQLYESYNYHMFINSSLTSGGSNTLSLSYSNYVNTGMGYYSSKGFTFTVQLERMIPSLSFTLKLPRLLWWECDGPNVTNLPFKFYISSAGSFRDKWYRLQVALDVTLYSREIQKAISFLGFYFQRFELQAVYKFVLNGPSVGYGNSLQLNAKFTLTPVLGLYLTRVKAQLGATCETNLDGIYRFDIYLGLAM